MDFPRGYSADKLSSVLPRLRRVLRMTSKALRGTNHPIKKEPLTEVQIGILSARASGKTRKEIAYSLGLSLKTVEYHFARIYRFLDVSNDIELTHYAIHNGLIPVKQFPSKQRPSPSGKLRLKKKP